MKNLPARDINIGFFSRRYRAGHPNTGNGHLRRGYGHPSLVYRYLGTRYRALKHTNRAPWHGIQV
jgi:hypothetical protein